MKGLTAVFPNFEGMVMRVTGVRGGWRRQGEAGVPAAQKLPQRRTFKGSESPSNMSSMTDVYTRWVRCGTKKSPPAPRFA